MHTSRLWSPSRIRVILAALALVACDTGTVGFSGPNKQTSGTGPDSTAGLTLTVTPNPVRISVGATGQFSARLQDATGTILSDPVTWGSNNNGIATIDGNGLATGQAAGNTTISASAHGLSTSASLEVDAVPVASVSVTPRVDTLQVGSQDQLTAVTKDAVGNTLTGRQVTWTSRSLSLATVSPSGVVTAVAVGDDSVLATSEGVTGASVITVVDIPVASVVLSPGTADTVVQGGSLQLTATPKDAGGNSLKNRTITWSTDNSAVATVSSAGLVNAVSVGAANITAATGGKSASVGVTVILAPVATVTVSPKTPNILVGNTVQLGATTRDAKGNTLTGRTVTWGSGTPGTATVNGTGLVSGVAAGTSVITATSEGVPGTATVSVTVAPPTLVRIIMTPDTATINTGGTKQFATTGKYSDSSTASVTPTYTATGGNVSASGLYTAGANGGTFRVVATSSGFADTSTVTVVKPPVALVLLSPVLDTVAKGAVYQLTATTKDALGNVLTGRVVTWGSSNTAVATVSGTGAVTAVAAGTATITATSETIPGTATTVVTVVLAKTVSVTPAGASVVQGNTVTLSATARDAGGNILTGHGVAWASLSPTIATVNGSGTVTGVAVGTATIQATVDTAHGTTTVRVDSLSTAVPWLLEDYSSYTSTSNLLSDPRGIYSVGEDVYNAGEIVLDPTIGYGTSTQSMRYNFPDRTGDASSRCGDYSIGRNVVLPNTVTELWVEIAARYQSNWTTVAPSSWACASNSDYKFVAARVNGTGRFMLFAGTYGQGWQFGYPGNDEGANSDTPGVYGNSVYPFSTTGNPWDGQWHVYRFHYKVGNPGAAEWWYDGVKMPSFQNVDASVASNIYGIAIGRNMNQGPGQAMSIWWGRIAVYKTNPGW